MSRISSLIKNITELLFGVSEKPKTRSLIKKNNKPPKGYDRARGTKP